MSRASVYERRGRQIYHVKAITGNDWFIAVLDVNYKCESSKKHLRKKRFISRNAVVETLNKFLKWAQRFSESKLLHSVKDKSTNQRVMAQLQLLPEQIELLSSIKV